MAWGPPWESRPWLAYGLPPGRGEYCGELGPPPGNAQENGGHGGRTSVQEMILDGHVPPLAVAGFAQTSAERDLTLWGRGGRDNGDIAHHRQRPLLGLRCERPRRAPPRPAMNSRRRRQRLICRSRDREALLREDSSTAPARGPDLQGAGRGWAWLGPQMSGLGEAGCCTAEFRSPPPPGLWQRRVILCPMSSTLRATSCTLHKRQRSC